MTSASRREVILRDGTVSYQKIILKVREHRIPLRLKRHLAPRTVRLVLSRLPMSGNVHRHGSMVYINTEINAGLERGRKTLAAGSVAFLPGQKCLCFVIRDHTPGRLMTPVGVMEGDYSVLDQLESGDILHVYEETG